MKPTLYHALLVAAGSAVGGLARWGVGLAAARLVGSRFPWGTLLINLSGCLFIGWFGTLLGRRGWAAGEELRLLLAVGFTGAYTTFSAFEYEACALLRGGATWPAAAYLLASVGLGLAAVRLGAALAEAG